MMPGAPGEREEGRIDEPKRRSRRTDRFEAAGETAFEQPVEGTSPGDRVRERLGEADVRVRGFVRERPFVSVGIALAAGYLVARMLFRR